ncbi:hypothetical protein KGF57_000106 [Candida theae]|uniref:CST complex subunit Stn1 N-terminal domain-containing protein n=1 Tax=Candida theae TaxID=1198502 RepID=A0AAD5BJE5_9ASCO|nr:uncharacterized protein KGF57_000106 [Candida theae]KAI5968412.1 hypothetical protein KGF57_000106 [Candida theae]
MQACPTSLYEQHRRIDWQSPGNHIVAKNGDIEYYRAELFSLADTFGKYTPIFINDINNQLNFRRHYNELWEYLHDLIMVNNWPINKFSIVGKVVGERLFDRGGYGGARLSIDDSSGKDSIVEIFISLAQYEAIFPVSGTNFGKLVEVRGTFKNWRPVVDSITVVSSVPNDLTRELSHWAIRVKFRETVLQKPWKFVKTMQEEKRLDIEPPKDVRLQVPTEPIRRGPRKSVDIVIDLTGDDDTQDGTPEVEFNDITQRHLENTSEVLLHHKHIYIKLVKESLVVIIKNSFRETTLDDLVSNRYVLNQINVFAEVLQQFHGFHINYRSEIIFRLALYFKESELFEFTDSIIKSAKFQFMYHSIQRKLSTRTQIKTLKYLDYLTKRLQINNCDYKLVNFLIRYIVSTSDLRWKYIKDEIKWIRA